ncbi:WD40 repeat domain-containing serine/threonine protein kinase [Nonomuraea sediminis]|uniref:WD40 repeat domain-containing serine/threonine protein kinase n=1 Tax=Nonomuraea sediminis TaxID=2835864 RepID=UPI001BDD685D|nr:WD40 repeat domain-containing serine/threonine protein kinase [Nonomuraea sediminis]
MPTFAPLRPGDPETLGGHVILGRLGEGGQGVVFLARDPSGTHVAVKLLQADDQVSIGRFLREAQVAQQVAPFCTAAVLGTGVEADRPFIVSEYIEGASLHRVVQEQGPRSGSTLHRLAIGTATALAAIHQAGIVHRDFKPANVIIAADGPRVIDFGIARSLNATSTLSNMPVGTPSYMAPEQVLGHPVGPAADLFSWASTMVYAASGRAPFGSDTMPAVINRVLNHPPDLGVLEGPLRDVVASCLSKDPAQRPTAEQVIMRLLQHPVTGSGMLAQGAAAAQAAASAGRPQPSHPQPSHPQISHPQISHPQPSHPYAPHAQPPHAQPPNQGWPPHPQYGQPATHPVRRKSRAPIIIGVSVAVALAVVAAVALAVPWQRISAAGLTTASPSPTVERRTAEPRTTPTSVPTDGIKRVQLPGGPITLYEHPADPITLTSYEIYNKKADDWIDYARGSLRGTFKKYPGNWESLVSPDGRSLASRGRNYTSDNYDSIIITDRESGGRTTVKTVRSPLISSIRSWSRDGSRILLNIEKEDRGNWTYLGFVIVDVKAGKAKVIKVADQAIRDTAFGWDGSEQGAVNVVGKDKGLRFFDETGKATRTATGVGKLASGTDDIFSPSGKMFVTNCPGGGDGDHCLWDAETGERVRKFSSDCDKVLGWYDESHLFCWEQDNGTKDEIQVVDFQGRLVRKLLDLPNEFDFSPVFTMNHEPDG